MRKKRVILDMDPGVDDAIGLALALASPEIEILGVTTVCGNVDLERTTANALKVLYALGAESVPVYMGAARPLLRQPTTEGYFGKDGLGDTEELEAPLKPRTTRAAMFIVETVMSSQPNSVEVITTGPLTNLATAYLMEPSIPQMLAGHVAMCGAFGVTPYGRGNITPVSEFNAFVDPEAAKVVLTQETQKLVAGLDATNRPDAGMNSSFCRKLEASGSKTGAFVARISRRIVERDGYLSLHDPIAVAISMYNSLVKTEAVRVHVVTSDDALTRGQTIAERTTNRTGRSPIAPAPNAEICVDIDGQLFLSYLYDRLTRQ